MLGSKKCDFITLYIMLFAVVLSFAAVCFPNIFVPLTEEKENITYQEKVFGKNIINIDISVDEDDWNEMIENKTLKNYISCNLSIDGEQFDNVGIRPKGNSSLTTTNGERIGFRVDFDHYIKNQNCYGLTQFVLNNTQADASYMKDYIAYDLMEYCGANSPLHTFAYITLNGEPFGVYAAVEVYNEDYLARVYNDKSIRLYNVKSSGFDSFENAVVDSESCNVISSKGMEKASGMGGPGGPPPNGMGGPPPNGMEGQPPNGMGGFSQTDENMPPNFSKNVSQSEIFQNSDNNIENKPQEPFSFDKNDGKNDMHMGPPGMEGGGGDGDLVYNGDSTENYKYIFANSVFDDTRAKDYAKVIRAIKYLNKENVTTEELEKYWNIDEILRYLAVHIFMVNTDSYISNMMQNYYLAEQDGIISVLPWDYNLSFGAFSGGPGGEPGQRRNEASDNTQESDDNLKKSNDKGNNSAVQAVNFPIDTPVSGVEMEDRPLVSVLLGIDEYKQKYYEYLSQLCEYVPNDFTNKLNIIEKEIYPYIEKDATSAYTPEEHIKAFETVKEFMNLRCESIKGQINGTVPSTSSAQETESAKLIQTNISIKDMGSMNGGNGGPPDMANNEGNGSPPDMANKIGNMPPPMMNGNGMPPPPPPGNMPPPGMMGNYDNSENNSCIIPISIGIIFVGIIFLFLYKRKF